jgi:peptidoglycan DL-endopeptidase LytF
MKLKLISLLIIVSIFNTKYASVQGQCQNFYTINTADTCDNIAAAFRTTTSNLQLLNPSLNCANLPPITAGSQICVPYVNNNIMSTTSVSPVSATCTTNTFYTIFSGDICDNIAGAFKTTTQNLLQLNPGLNCAALTVGQRICVPSSASSNGFQPIQTVCGNNFYTVFSGDTCDNIAGAFRTTSALLIQLNPGNSK